MNTDADLWPTHTIPLNVFWILSFIHLYPTGLPNHTMMMTHSISSVAIYQ